VTSILCPVDFSEFSRRALHHAEAAAKWYAADLHVLHVLFDVMPRAVPALAPSPPTTVEDIGPATIEALRAFVKQSGVTCATTQVVRDGPVAREIANYAGEVNTDLIVMGTHGHTGVDHAIIGSTTERVLHRAPCPVLTIPKVGDEPGSADRERFTHVLCAIDFSPSSLAALSHGLSFAQENDAKLTLLHVVETLSDDDALIAAHFRVGEYIQTRKEDARQQLVALVRGEARASREPSTLVELGGAARTILRVADQLNADLIVMGAQGRAGISLLLFGSTTHTVVRHAVCPVITARA